MDNINIALTPMPEVFGWVWKEMRTQPCFALGILFAGDRERCVDEALTVKVDDVVVAVCTISYRGEMDSGRPTIVGLYVTPTQRHEAIGRQLFQRAIERMIQARNCEAIEVSVLNSKVLRMIRRLPEELQQRLRVIDCSDSGSVDELMDR